MILPIVAYGDPVLRKECMPIAKDYPELPKLIEDMYQTMYHSNGVGLAAPQVGLAIRLFVVDTEPFCENDDLSDAERDYLKGFKKALKRLLSMLKFSKKKESHGHSAKGVSVFQALVRMSYASPQ